MHVTAADLDAVEHRIVDRIPLTRHLGLSLAAFDERGLVLTAPLAPNVNHRGTAFGGSLSTLATLAGWSLIQLLLQDHGLHAKTVVHHSTVRYLKPITDDFEVHAAVPPSDEVATFAETLRRRGRARLAVHCRIVQGDLVGVEFEGAFVALRSDKPD